MPIVHNDIEISINQKKTYHMAVACKNENGDSDIVFVKVKCTSADLDKNKDKKLAIKWARDNFCISSPVAFNCEVDPLGKFLAKAFVWKSASIVG